MMALQSANTYLFAQSAHREQSDKYVNMTKSNKWENK